VSERKDREGYERLVLETMREILAFGRTPRSFDVTRGGTTTWRSCAASIRRLVWQSASLMSEPVAASPLRRRSWMSRGHPNHQVSANRRTAPARLFLPSSPGRTRRNGRATVRGCMGAMAPAKRRSRPANIVAVRLNAVSDQWDARICLRLVGSPCARQVAPDPIALQGFPARRAVGRAVDRLVGVRQA
jgi:hypothetical protein